MAAADVDSSDGEMFKDEAYFLAVLEFLALYNWIYDFKVTKFFSERIWEKIEPEWTEALLEMSNDELNQLPYGFYKKSWSASLKQFITESLQFSMTRKISDNVTPANIQKEIQRGMSPKKAHEVSRLAGVISTVMSDQSLDTVIDVGAGLGYLGHVLNHQYGYRVISLECESARTHSAENRTQNKHGDLSTNPRISSITFELKDNCESRDEFEKILHDLRNASKCAHCTTANTDRITDRDDNSSRNCPQPDDNQISLDGCAKTLNYSSCSCTNVHTSAKEDSSVKTKLTDSSEDLQDSHHCSTMCGKVCMIGLHCCGDLTPSILGYFTQFDAVAALCCVSCCYHRMARTTVAEKNEAINFPMSQACQRSLKHVKMNRHGWCLSQYAFRLAAQETRSRWREQTVAQHEFHTRNVAYRALLEVLIEQEAGFKKLVRKVVRKSHFDSFDAYISAALDRVDIGSNMSGADTSKRQDLEDQLHSLHEKFKPYFRCIEPITALQVLLQPVLETLIHSDRRQYLKERGFTAQLIPVFDESLSPRNIALIVKKS